MSFHYRQGYHRTTPKNKHAGVRLLKSQKLFIVKSVKSVKIKKLKIKRSSRPQSPVFVLKIGEDQKEVSPRAQSPVFPLKIGEDQKFSSKNL